MFSSSLGETASSHSYRAEEEAPTQSSPSEASLPKQLPIAIRTVVYANGSATIPLKDILMDNNSKRKFKVRRASLGSFSHDPRFEMKFLTLLWWTSNWREQASCSFGASELVCATVYSPQCDHAHFGIAFWIDIFFTLLVYFSHWLFMLCWLLYVSYLLKRDNAQTNFFFLNDCHSDSHVSGCVLRVIYFCE